MTLNDADPKIGIMATSIISGSALLVLGPSGNYYDTQANIGRLILHMRVIQNAEPSLAGKRVVSTAGARPLGSECRQRG